MKQSPRGISALCAPELLDNSLDKVFLGVYLRVVIIKCARAQKRLDLRYDFALKLFNKLAKHRAVTAFGRNTFVPNGELNKYVKLYSLIADLRPFLLTSAYPFELAKTSACDEARGGTCGCGNCERSHETNIIRSIYLIENATMRVNLR